MSKETLLAHDQSRGAQGYVAVRGIFDLKKQLKNFQNANIPNPTVDMIEFVDFVLERQRAIDGEDPWSGPWELVELEIAKADSRRNCGLHRRRRESIAQRQRGDDAAAANRL